MISIHQNRTPIKILYLDASRGMYGASRVLLTLLEGIDRHKYSPYVLLANDLTSEEIRFPGELKRINIPYGEEELAVLRRSKYLNPRGIIWICKALMQSVPKLVNFIKRNDIQIVHSNTCTILTGIIASSFTGTPHVCTVHEVLRWEGLILSPFIFLFSRYVTAVSEASANSLRRYFPSKESKLIVIKNGIDPSAFRNIDLQKVSALKEEWRIGPDEYLVGMIGRIGGWKGENLFVEMAKIIVKEMDNVKFAIVGGVFDGRNYYYDNLRNKIKKEGLENKILVTGLRTDIPIVLSNFDVFVLPSIKPESFPTVILEAMAAAKPVVATNHGGPKEMVHDSKSGFLVDYLSPHEMADRVMLLLNDETLRFRLGIYGLELVKSKYSHKKYVERYEILYQKMLASNEAVAE